METGNFMTHLSCLALLFGAQTTALDSLQAEYAAATKPTFDSGKLATINQKVLDLIDSGDVSTPIQFRIAAGLITDFRFRFEVSRVRHELALCALANDATTDSEELAKTWDGFLISTGRSQRIGSFDYPGEQFKVDSAPRSIVAVLKNPVRARLAAATKTPSQEIEKIVTADQAARAADWSKLTQAQLEAIQQGDAQRKARVLQLLKSGKVVTFQDFERSSLVMQHGQGWNDYVIAHELAMCSLLLGSNKSAWLCAATYDRLMGSAGYRQRFGTQYSSDGNGPFKHDPVDTRGINDAMRKALSCPTLKEASERKFD